MNMRLINALVSAVDAIKDSGSHGVIVTFVGPIELAYEFDAVLDSKGVYQGDILKPSDIASLHTVLGAHIVLVSHAIELSMGDVQVKVERSMWQIISRCMPSESGPM